MEHAPRPLSQDTPLDVERRWIAVLRELGPARRLELTFALSSGTRRRATDAFDLARPGATPRERRDWLLRSCYGDDVADRYWEFCDRTGRDGCG